jgi:hypothetical protein
MQFAVMLPTHPAHIKRLGVVIVMSVHLYVSTHLARLPLYPSGGQGEM